MTPPLPSKKSRLMAVASLIGLAAASPGMATAAAAKELRGQKYGPDRKHVMDIFLPEGIRAGEKRKVVLFFHGGAWSMGGVGTHRFVGRALAAKGYVAAVATYRLYPRVRFPAFMYDAGKAVAWLRQQVAQHGGDPDRIYLMGHSAGAHIAALLALDPRYLNVVRVPRSAIAGVVGLAGPYVFEPKRWKRIAPIFKAHPKPSARPVDFVKSFKRYGGPPLFLVQGGLDRLVRNHEGPGLATAYRAVGGKATVKTYPRLGHGGVLFAFHKRMRWTAPVLKDVTAWIGTPK